MSDYAVSLASIDTDDHQRLAQSIERAHALYPGLSSLIMAIYVSRVSIGICSIAKLLCSLLTQEQ